MDRWDLLYVASTLASIFVPLIIAFVLVLSGKQWKAAQDSARARRIAEYRMNARLLRLNI
jgi:hypothetical protein